MKNKFIKTIPFLLLLILLFKFTTLLQSYCNLLIYNVDRPTFELSTKKKNNTNTKNKDLDKLFDALLNVDNKYIRSSSVCLTAPKFDLGTRTLQLKGIDTYYDDLYHLSLSNGRFFLNEDICHQKNYIIIPTNLSTKLFAKENCIGQSLSIKGQNYIVIGVYNPSKNPLMIKTPNDAFTLFVPYNNVHFQKHLENIQVTYLTLDTLSGLISYNFSKQLNEIYQGKLYNIDALLRREITKFNLAITFLMLITLLILIKYGKDLINQYYHCRKPAFGVKFFCLFVIFLTLMVCLIYLPLDIYIDPSLLPHRLINFKEIKYKYLAYSRQIKPNYSLKNSLYDFILFCRPIINFLCLLLLIAYYIGLKFLKKG